MNRRLEQTLEVLEEVWIRRGYLARLRRLAVNKVAERRHIAPNTVQDKLVRQLFLRAASVDDFDSLISLWLGGRHEELRTVLLSRAESAGESARIEAFFTKHKTRTVT